MSGLPARMGLRQYAVQTAEARTGAKSVPTKRKSHLERRRKAAYLVSRALRKGELTKKPCEVCGNPRAEAHHDDYKKPLEVIWLCVRHHAMRHNHLGRGPKMQNSNWKEWTGMVVTHWYKKPSLVIPSTWNQEKQQQHWESLLRWMWELVEIMELCPYKDNSEFVAEQYGAMGAQAD
jgi:hypothetical protein